MKEELEYLSAILVELRLLNSHLGASRQPQPQPQPAPKPAPNPAPIGIIDLRTVFQIGVERGKKKELAALLNEYGVDKLPSLQVRKYDEVYERALQIAEIEIEGKNDEAQVPF